MYAKNQTWISEWKRACKREREEVMSTGGGKDTGDVWNTKEERLVNILRCHKGWKAEI
jgi:hypothetical protein